MNAVRSGREGQAMAASSKQDDDDKLLVHLTATELGQLVRAAVRDELGARPPTPARPATCTVAEAARELGTSTSTIKRWIATGRLQASRAVLSGSSRVRISRESVDRLMRDAAAKAS